MFSIAHVHVSVQALTSECRLHVQTSFFVSFIIWVKVQGHEKIKMKLAENKQSLNEKMVVRKKDQQKQGDMACNKIYKHGWSTKGIDFL